MNRGIKRSKDGRRQERLNTELLKSILQSDPDKVRRLLGEGANPNARCRSSYASALHIAALRGNADIVTELIKANANLTAKDNKGYMPIHLAACSGYKSVIKIILNHLPKLVNAIVKYEKISVVQEELDSWNHNHAEITELLPEVPEGSTPLHIASSLCRKLTTEFLLSQHADVNIKDCQGLTALDVAGIKAKNDYNFIEHDKKMCDAIKDQQAVFKELYPSIKLPWIDQQSVGSHRNAAGSNVTSRSHSRSASLIDNNIENDNPRLYPSISLIEKPVVEDDNYLCETDFHSVQENSSTTLDIVKMLVQFGAKVKDENEDRSEINKNPITALHTAVLNNDLQLIDWLLEDCQCDHMLIITNEDGDTPLHVAIKKRFFDALRTMISWLELDTLNKTDKFGNTALYLAVELDWLEGIGILLEAGADIKIKCSNNDTVINLAVRKNNPKLLEELLSADEEPDLLIECLEEPLLTTIENLNLACLRILLDYDVNVNAKFDNMGTTPLIKATAKGWIEGVEALLSYFADVTLKTNSNESVYHIAAKLGNSTLLTILLNQKDYNLVINETDDDFFTPLFFAIQSGCLECVKALITLNARVDLLLPNSVNILHFAVQNFPCTEQIILWICNEGFVSAYNLNILINSFNDDGLTPFEMAASLGLLNCIKSMLGAYPRIVTNLRGTSACHLAARCGYADILEVLIRYDPKCLEIKKRKDWTPLHVAARSGHGNCVVILLKYGANISSCVTINDTSKSALDLIVDYVPMAKETFTNLFDTYITEINIDKTDAHSSIEIDYSLLVGTSYIKNTKTSSKSSINSSNESLTLLDHEKGRQMIFIKTLLNTTNEDLKDTLLLHPLIETFLYFKWDSLKYFFIILLSLYLIYTTVLISFAFLNYVFAISTVNWILIPIILLILLPLAITEIIHAKALPYVYFLDIESWLKIFMILTGITVACISSELEASRYIVSLSVLNSWTVVLFLLARFPTWGLHVLMFQKVSYNVVEVLSRFIFLFVGFLLAFIIHFEGEPPFGNFLEATCKVMIMLFELDYSGIFEKGEKMTLHSLIGRFMFVAFGLLVAMVMVNLIVGLSVSDIAQLEIQGRSQRLAKQTSFLVSLELIVYNDWIVKCIPKCLQNSVQKYRKIERKKIVHPDDPNCPFPIQCKDALLRHGFCDEDQPSVEHCLQKINLLSDQVNELEVKMDKIISILTHKNLGLN